MNEVKIHNLFPVPVFHYKLENYQETNQELLNYILELQKKDKIGNSHSNKGGWHSPNFDIVNEGPAIKFINKIKDYLKHIKRIFFVYNSPHTYDSLFIGYVLPTKSI